MTIPNYLDSISKRYKQGNTTEHTFRGDLQQLIESLLPGIRATNEPERGVLKSKAERLDFPSTNFTFIRFFTSSRITKFFGIRNKAFLYL